MCVVSMIMDDYHDRWRRRYWPQYPPNDILPLPIPVPYPVPARPLPTPEEIEEFRRLLERARDYDKKNKELDCELEEKRQQLRKLAEALGVKIDFV